MTDNEINSSSTFEQVHHAFVIAVVKAINSGRSTDKQIFSVIKKLLSAQNFPEVKIDAAVRTYMKRLCSLGYIYMSRSSDRWVWMSKPGWPILDEQASVNVFMNDRALRLDDLLKPVSDS